MAPAPLPGDLRAVLGEDALGRWCAVERAGGVFTLRTLHERLAARPDARLLFAEEARRIGGLRHPFLLRVLEQQPDGPIPWILTERTDGETLESRLAAGGPLPAPAALDLSRRLADALGLLAKRRQVHIAPVPRRVVRVGEEWRLLTFREVRADDETRALKGRAFPDPAFLPPEARADHPDPVRPAPFLAWSVGAFLRSLVGEVAGARDDPRVREALARLLDPRPSARPVGAEAVIAVLEGNATGPATPGTGPRPTAPVPRRRRE
jgi:hypothetical protein